MSEPTVRPTAVGRDIAVVVRVRQLWRLRLLIGVGLATAVTGIGVGLTVDPVAGIVVAAVVGISIASVGIWWTDAAWRAWSFRLTDTAIELRHGVVVRRSSTIPFHRVQLIDAEAGPLERRLALTRLRLRTAAASTDGAVPGIDASVADSLRAEILALVGVDDAV